ncbi:MAG TPA: DNA polymerase/3'-5' exonuclease PolX [Terriglobales bacterium]|nr:DNA polymerase/3'-5' exonuclease PolX [Terriglobales bacterium]
MPAPTSPQRTGISRAEIARLFEKTSRALALRGQDRFRVLAYEKAARSLRDLDRDLGALARAGELDTIPGIGKDLAGKIEEGLRTGHIRQCERECQSLPDALLALFEIRNLGPKTIALLHRRYQVNSAADLQRLLASGRLAEAAGFGEKKLERLREAVASWLGSRGRMLLGEALPAAEAFLAQVRALPGVERAEVAGSIRRGCETIGDVDVVAAARQAGPALQQIAALAAVSRVLAVGPTRASLLLGDLQVDVRAVAPESFGAALQYFTGSKPHNTRLRALARQHGLKINEYGVFRGARRLGGAQEEDIYHALGMPLIPPELREDRGEVEAALAGALPRLIEPADLRGDLHAHTTYSDGRADCAAMAAAAAQLGYQYLALTDHSPGQRIAHGLDAVRLRQKRKEIAALQAHRGETPPRLLLGAEVDILADGRLDYPDQVLAGIDVVIAAVHDHFLQPAPQMTERLLAAIANPHVQVLAHPTARLIGSRPPVAFDFDRVARAAQAAGVALELDGSPWRLDLNDVLARRARELGATLAIGSDAHSTAQLAFVRFGVAQARRAGVPAAAVLNTWPWEKLQTWLQRRRPAAAPARSRRMLASTGGAP